jgi:hypothetical protein
MSALLNDPALLTSSIRTPQATAICTRLSWDSLVGTGQWEGFPALQGYSQNHNAVKNPSSPSSLPQLHPHLYAESLLQCLLATGPAAEVGIERKI